VLLVPCPWCGPREEIEFRYGGQAGIAYPSDPDALSDEAWADFLFMRDNPKGAFAERWYHVAGAAAGSRRTATRPPRVPPADHRDRPRR
jgi:heterotetrameric sarcosine oxidase delta subunit